jgi:aminopeptidase N
MFKTLVTLIIVFSVANIFVPGFLLSQSLYEIPEDFHDFRQSEQKRFDNFALHKYAEDPEKIEQQRQYDVTWYGLDIAVDPVLQTVSGSVSIQGKSVVSSLQTVVLDFSNGLVVNAVNGDNVSSFTHNQNLINVQLTSSLASGNEFEITISYEGTPPPSGFGSFVFATRQGSNEPLIWSLSEPFYARTWWPSKDIPEDKADSADVSITVPQELTAVSNGVLREVKTNGDGTKTFFWHEQYPITTYLISVALSDYDYFVEYVSTSANDSLPLEYYITPEKSSGAFSVSSGLTETKEMLSVFSELFGPYPFAGEKYAQVEFGWSGGMEHQTATSINIRHGNNKRLEQHLAQ